MPGTPVFSDEAARVLVDAYLAQPEGQRDLRRVLAAAKQGHVDTGWRESVDPKDMKVGGPVVQGKPVPVDPSVIRELAGMSKSQAYELLRQDPRYQPSTVEQAEELSQRNLDLARRIIEVQEKLVCPDAHKLREAQRLIHMVEWGRQDLQRQQARKDARLSGLLR